MIYMLFVIKDVSQGERWGKDVLLVYTHTAICIYDKAPLSVHLY